LRCTSAYRNINHIGNFLDFITLIAKLRNAVRGNFWNQQLEFAKQHYVYPCQRFSSGNTLEDYNP
jgi:hypothetical protein